MRSTKRLIAKLVFVAVFAVIAPVHAGPYPDRPIRMVVPFPAGGMTDILARMLSERLLMSLGRPVIIDNRGGAGGILGVDIASKAPADGYTLVLGTAGTHAVNTTLYTNLPYNPARDFDPIVPIAYVPNVLVVSTQSRFTSLADLVAGARRAPGSVTYGTTGIGASPQLSAEVLKELARIDALEVTYRGGAPALLAVMGGEVDFIFDAIATSLPGIRDGRLRALGVSGARRSSALPDVPAIAELGYANFDVVAWYGLFAPSGTPPEILDRLNESVNSMLGDAAVRERLRSMGAEVMGGSRAAFRQFHAAEIERWGAFLRSRNISLTQ